MTNRSTLAVAISATIAALSLPGQALALETTYIIQNGEQSKAEASCTRIVRQFTGLDCTVGNTQTSSGNSWVGPIRQAGYYVPGSAGDSLTYNPNDAIPGNFDPDGVDPADPDNIKVSPRVVGTVTIDDQGTPDGTDDTILLNFSIQGATPTAGIVRNTSTGQTTQALERFQSLDHTMAAPYTVNAAIPNANGGFDYIIGSRGTPVNICRALLPGGPGDSPPGDNNTTFDPDDCFPSPNVTQPTLPVPTPWYAPIPAIGSVGIERSARLADKPGPGTGAGPAVPNIGLQTQGTFSGSYSCLTNSGGGVDCTTGLLVWGAGEDPGFDNVTGIISTGAAGITSAKLYWTQEYFIGAFGAPPGDNSYQAGAITFSGIPQSANAIDDAFTVIQNSANNTLNVLANDIDFPPGSSTVTIIDGPVTGSAAVNPDKTINYTPAPGSLDTDTFTYEVAKPDPDNVGSFITDTAVVTITIEPNLIPSPSVPPISLNTQGRAGAAAAASQTVTGLGNLPATITFTNDGDDSKGTCTVAGAVITYTPTTAFVAGGATDSCAFTVTDANGDTGNGTVNVSIAQAAPTLSGGSAQGAAGGATANGVATLGNGVVANHTAVVTTSPTSGSCTATVTSATNVRVQYQPEAGFSGDASCVVELRDADGSAAPATFTFTIENTGIKLPGGSGAVDPWSLLLLGGLPLLRRRSRG